jgi:hypothetical protein
MKRVRDESPKAAALRVELERLCSQIALSLPVGNSVGFVLVLADFGERGNMSYASNVNRVDALRMLTELAEKIEIDG